MAKYIVLVEVDDTLDYFDGDTAQVLEQAHIWFSDFWQVSLTCAVSSRVTKVLPLLPLGEDGGLVAGESL